MSLYKLGYLSVIALLVVALTGCPPDTAEPTTDDDDVRVEQANVDEFRSKMDSRLDQVESDINELERRRAQVDTDDNGDDDAQNLREDLQDVRQRLQEPAQDDYGNWASHRDDVRSDVYDLERRVDRKLVEAAQTGEEIQSTARERMERMDTRRQEIARDYREYRGTEQRQQQDQQQRDQQQRDDRPSWEQNYEDARQDAEERLAEIPQLGLDDLDDARGDVAGNLEDMRSALENGEDRVYEARDERRRERADRRDRDNDYDNN